MTLMRRLRIWRLCLRRRGFGRPIIPEAIKGQWVCKLGLIKSEMCTCAIEDAKKCQRCKGCGWIFYRKYTMDGPFVKTR